MTKEIVTTVLLLAFLSGSAGAAQTGIGSKAAADADRKKTILLKDYQPEPALHAAVHEIRRAKFRVIEVHTHTPTMLPASETASILEKWSRAWIASTSSPS